jgi:MFS-type transporter involved in bile tolerance (Atg22 family)
MTRPDRGGSQAGLFFLASQAASIIGPVLAGGVLDLAGRNYRALFLYIPLTMLGGWLWMLRVRRGEAARTDRFVETP